MERNHSGKKRGREATVNKIGITCYPTIGGSGVIATELGKQLAEKGYEIHFITSSIPFRLESIHPNIYFHQVEVNHYPVFQYPPYDLALANKMAEVIDMEKLDILHVHYAMPHAVCAVLARNMAKHKAKIVTTLHGTDITVLGIDKSLTKIIRHGIEESDAVTAVSRSLVEQTQSIIGVEKHIHPIHNFIDEKEYHQRDTEHLRSRYGVEENEKIIIHISNFRKVKRVNDVLTAFKKIEAAVPSRLFLVGDGPEYPEMHQLAADMGIDTKVKFLGKQANVADLLNISDLKLLLSEKESFGLVLLEAMACGVPCIGTKVGGIPEVIRHGENGFLTELGDTDTVAQRAIQILSDDTLWKSFSNQAIRHVRTSFYSEKIVQQYENVFKQVLLDGEDDES